MTLGVAGNARRVIWTGADVAIEIRAADVGVRDGIATYSGYCTTLLVIVTRSQRCCVGFVASTGNDADMEPLVLESCHSTWLFDTERMRFRRILKGLDLDSRLATTDWRPYYGLDLDPVSESFVVLLNQDGTRLLRSWRHVEHCTQCGGEATGELSLDELRTAARA